MKKIKAVFVISIFILIAYATCNDKNICKKANEQRLESSYSTIVVKKYIDENHLYKKIVILVKGDSTLLFEDSVEDELYNEINVGDSIKKNKGDSILTISNSEKKKHINIKIKCKE